MKKTILAALIISALAATAALARHANPTYIPPAEPGQIFTVINYPRAQGKAQTATISTSFAGTNRSIIAIAPGYQNPCTTSTPAGVVLKLRHSTAEPTPLTLTTNGTIIRGPYQGDPPPELLHACYKLIT